MPRLYSIMVLKVTPGSPNEPIVCCQTNDVSDVGMFQRSSAREFLLFFSRTVAKRMTPLSRTQVSENGRILFAHSFANGSLVATAISDDSYAPRVAFSMLTQVEDTFLDTFRGQWEGVNRDEALTFPYLADTMTKYQNPEQAERELQCQWQREDVAEVVRAAVDKVVDRSDIDRIVGDDTIKFNYTPNTSKRGWCVIC